MSLFGKFDLRIGHPCSGAGVLIVIFTLMCVFPGVSIAVPTESYLEFSGAQHYVEMPHQSALDLSTNTFTMSAWIKPVSWGQNNQGRIIDHGGGSSGSSGWTLQIQNSGSEVQLIRFKINNDSSYNRSSNAGVLTLDTWQHIAITYDNGTLTFYVNGLEQGVSTGVPVPSPRISPLRIGMRSTDMQRSFDGGIDEVRIWGRVLSVAEIQANMSVELSGSETGLIAYYRFNDAAGQIATDDSVVANHATLGSTPISDLNDPVWTTSINFPPVVDAGPDQTVVLSSNTANLAGSYTDDGLPGTGVTTTWGMVSGPAPVVFSDAASVDSTATFTVAGLYQLRLQADDGELTGFDDIMVTVDATAVLTSIDVLSSATRVNTGGLLLFTATGYDQAGNPMSINPAWSTTGGSIDSYGNYTAPALAGVYTVTAAVGSITGSKEISVTDPGAYVWPTDGWTSVSPAEAGLQQSLLEQARDYALSGGGSGIITKNGQQVLAWGDQSVKYNLKSATKSFGAALVGVAVMDGLVDIDEYAQVYLPEVGVPPDTNIGTGWLEQITLKHLLTHTAGFDQSGGYIDLLFQPGTVWSYSNGGANWLADVITVSFSQDLKTVLFDRLLTPMGLSASDLGWRDNSFREQTINGVDRREFGSGITANVDAMARFGYLFLRMGEWNGLQILPDHYISELGTAVPELDGLPVNLPGNYFSATDHYGYLWWNNADGTMPNVPTDAYWGWGLGDRLIVVIPSLDIVIARAGGAWQPGGGWKSDYSYVEPFLEPIVLSTLGETYNITTGSPTTMLDVLANDMSVGFGGETLTIINVGPTSNGGVVTNLSTSLEYTPEVGFIGIDSFEYTVQSSSGTTFTVTVTVNVHAVIADGDVNGDGVVDIRDILRGYRIILGLETPDSAEIQRGDVAPLIDGVPASNGVFDLGDLVVIQGKVIGSLTF